MHLLNKIVALLRRCETNQQRCEYLIHQVANKVRALDEEKSSLDLQKKHYKPCCVHNNLKA
ncbi:hypothetical protein Rin_00020650 [Candidatus Regiella insecticola 5.15]|uniref:Uncharacterized protein n=1 Tax=Candidatus Regiella insecticola 5.15 TaxID=1005043 RepID=G2H1W8_9ENTR|nr:hypothetical protein Rin_00020650 [Candidatus Regiella insecticola 5.15]